MHMKLSKCFLSRSQSVDALALVIDIQLGFSMVQETKRKLYWKEVGRYVHSVVERRPWFPLSLPL